MPNARRDHFEQNVHFADLAAHVQPLARSIAKQCRAASIERNRIKNAQLVTATLAKQLPALAGQRPDLSSEIAKCANQLKQVARYFAGRDDAPDASAFEAVINTLSQVATPPTPEAARAYMEALVQTGALSKADLVKLARGVSDTTLADSGWASPKRRAVNFSAQVPSVGRSARNL